MTIATWVAMFPLLALLSAAAVIDWRHRRIPNWLTLALLLGGLAQPLVSGGWPVSFQMALLGAVLGFSLLFLPFCFDVIGGGDIKLMTGVGAWLGPVGLLLTLAVVYLVEAGYLLALAAWQRRFTAMFKNTFALFVELIHVRGINADRKDADAGPAASTPAASSGGPHAASVDGPSAGKARQSGPSRGGRFVSIGRRLPYAVPTLIGTGVVLCLK